MPTYLDELLTYTKRAKAIAWDNCHKIYILLDDQQVEQMRGYGYDPLITAMEMKPKQMALQVQKWYSESCGLRFIQATSDPDTSDQPFMDVVSQFEYKSN